VILTPADIIRIQSAIDRYEKGFPHGQPPSAEDARRGRPASTGANRGPMCVKQTKRDAVESGTGSARLS
jgi:hypothetical protein